MTLHRRLLATALTMLATLPAFAHAKPKTMTPAANSTGPAPAEVSVYFTEAIEPKFSSLQLMDAQNRSLGKAPSKADPADHTHLTLAILPLVPGTYRVHWVTAAVDGHHMEGDYSFTVK